MPFGLSWRRLRCFFRPYYSWSLRYPTFIVLFNKKTPRNYIPTFPTWMWLSVTPLPVWVSLRSSWFEKQSCSDSTSDSNWYQILISRMNERLMPDNTSPLKHQRAVCFVSFQFPWSDENSHTVQVSPSSVPALWTSVSLIHSKMNPF